jgi:hypothetical protein
VDLEIEPLRESFCVEVVLQNQVVRIVIDLGKEEGTL